MPFSCDVLRFKPLTRVRVVFISVLDDFLCNFVRCSQNESSKTDTSTTFHAENFLFSPTHEKYFHRFAQRFMQLKNSKFKILHFIIPSCINMKKVHQFRLHESTLKPSKMYASVLIFRFYVVLFGSVEGKTRIIKLMVRYIHRL